MGKYAGYQELKRHESEGTDYIICSREGTSGIAVIAPHGGGIEPGTMEISDAIAGDEHTFYCFKGIKKSGNAGLHMSSKAFDEPLGVGLVKHSDTAISVHGCKDKQAVVYLGGLDRTLMKKIDRSLIQSGFNTDKNPVPGLQGKHPGNICNRSRTDQGVQLEISEALRRRMFDHLTDINGRKRTEVFDTFVSAVRAAISADNIPTK
jgi:phage replication-related protein YjqB (UPF0714/DUF867 family)